MVTGDFNARRAMMLTKMIFLGQLAGILFFMILVFYMAGGRFTFSADLKSPYFLVLFLVSVVAVPAAFLVARKKAGSVTPEDPLPAKYAAWQISVIIRMAAVEGIALFAAVCIMISGNLFYIVFFILALAVQVLNWPSPSKITREMPLTQSEIEQFYQNL